MNKAENAFLQKIEVAIENMNQMNLPPTFRQRVIDYYDYCWSLNKCMPRDEFLKDLSPSLASEMQMYYHLPIMTAKLFCGVSAEFLLGLIKHAEPRIFLRDDYIIHDGEYSKDLYFIEKGICQVVDHDGDTVLASRGIGEYFGEMGVLTNVHRSASVCFIFNAEISIMIIDSCWHQLQPDRNFKSIFSSLLC